MDENNTSFEQGFIESDLDDVMEQYYENPSEDTFHRVCDRLVRACVFNRTAICSFETGKDGIHHKTFTTPDYGDAFVVYTGFDKNSEEKEQGSYGFMPWGEILSKVIETWNCTGIVINPYSGHSTIVWVNHVFARIIMKYAMKETQKMNAIFDKYMDGLQNKKPSDEPEISDEELKKAADELMDEQDE